MQRKGVPYIPGSLTPQAQQIASSDFGNDMLVGTSGLFSSISGITPKKRSAAASAPRKTTVSRNTTAPEAAAAGRAASKAPVPRKTVKRSQPKKTAVSRPRPAAQ